MRRWMTLLVVGALVMAPAPVSSAVDGGGGGTYLPLGDSVAAGTQMPDPITNRGYTNRLYGYVRDNHGFDTFVNLACPGDGTIEMRFGTGGASTYGSACYGPYAQLPPGGTSQLDVAVEYLLTHPGEVGLITIAMGANDILACDLSLPEADLNACLTAQLGQIGANLPVIIGTLQAVAPGVPIVAMNYFNPNLAYWITGPAGQELAGASLGLTTIFNGTLQAVYDAMGVPVADVANAFGTYRTRGGVFPTNVRRICQLTQMCEKAGHRYVLSDYDPLTPGPQTDIHPSNQGYRRIASTHAHLIADLGLLD